MRGVSLGDHLLSNRFAAAIREKYPNEKITLYSDTEGNGASSKLLMKFFPSFYDSAKVIGVRKNQDFQIYTKFGKETYPSHIDNLPDDTLEEIKTSDIFYDLHIDSLKWIKSDFDWLRYYYFFPKVQINLDKQKYTDDGYILCHLYSRPNSPYNLEQWYVHQLLKNISPLRKVVVITQQEHKDFYKDIESENILVVTPNLEECFSLAQDCSLFLGIDSGIRYIPYHFSKPVFVFSKYCSEYGNVAESHLIRWLIFRQNVFPMHFNFKSVENIVKNSLENKLYHLFPQIQGKIDEYVVDRNL